ncbi:MAG: hypothetical protein E7541_02060 [Ruminococcaceae bacterium]|nr:hypothetical protein [Oscillospiraceae bacterium]
MEQKGIFRSAMRGFNKSDVLTYIDQITGEWHEERVQLTQQAEEAARESQRASDEARQAVEAAQATVDEAQQQLAAMREQLEQLTEQLQEMTAQRDVAVTEKAALEEQLQAEQEKAHTATAEMMAAEERLQTRDGEVATLREQLTDLQGQMAAYGDALGRGDEMKTHLDGIARPFMETANRTAVDTLDNVHTVLEALLGQLGELRDDVALRRSTLRQQKTESDEQFAEAVDAWVEKVRHLAKDSAGRTTRFFR